MESFKYICYKLNPNNPSAKRGRSNASIYSTTSATVPMRGLLELSVLRGHMPGCVGQCFTIYPHQLTANSL